MTRESTMKECRCGSFVPDDRRTCPHCGVEVNPAAADPPIQDQRRQGLVIAELRTNIESLTRQLNEAGAENAERSAESEALRTEIAAITREYREIQAEIATLKLLLKQLDERAHIMRSRFDAMNVPLFQPFVASQASLFTPERPDPPASEETLS